MRDRRAMTSIPSDVMAFAREGVFFFFLRELNFRRGI